MNPHIPLYRVVGVRANGERVVISTNNSLPMAEKAIALMRHGSDYKELLIESNGDGGSPWKQHVKN